MTRQARRISVIGPFPPPVHGFAVMTEALATALEDRAQVQRIDLAGRASARAFYHPSQALMCLRACLGIVLRPSGGPAAIGCNGGLGLIYTLALVSCARMARRPMTLHHHTFGYIDRPSRLMRTICAVGGGRLTHVFLARSMRDAFARRYGLRRPALILPNALFVTPQAEAARPPGPQAVPVIGLLSNLCPEKGLDDFIATARALRKAGIAAEMRLAGPVAAPRDRALIAAAEAEGLIRHLGPLYGAEKDAFYRDLDLFLFPTRYRYEAQPTVIYEAFAAGVPVIAFARGAIAEQVGDSLSVVPQGADFAQAVVAQLRALRAEDWPLLRTRARARLQADAACGAAALAELLRQGGAR